MAGALAGVTGSLPLISYILPNMVSRYAFPPLGQIDVAARIFAVALAVAVSFIVFFEKNLAFMSSRIKRVRVLRLSVLVALFFACSYLVCNLLLVREIPIETKGTSVLLSVGFERTSFAKQVFGSASDEHMLIHRDTSEAEVRRLWTLRSLVVGRLSLFLSYTGCLLMLVRIFSLGVLYDLSGEPPVP